MRKVGEKSVTGNCCIREGFGVKFSMSPEAVKSVLI